MQSNAIFFYLFHITSLRVKSSSCIRFKNYLYRIYEPRCAEIFMKCSGCSDMNITNVRRVWNKTLNKIVSVKTLN